jgi:hypothetical protein
MRIHNMVAYLLLLLGLTLSLPVFSQEETLDWLDNYKSALQEAKRTHKPIFLEYRCEP